MSTLNLRIGTEKDSNAHYIGRQGKGKNSALANPFKPLSKTKKEHTRVCLEYKTYLLSKIESNDQKVLSELAEILVKASSPEGVTLFCPGYCQIRKNPLPCHGQIIADLLNKVYPNVIDHIQRFKNFRRTYSNL